MIYSKTIPLRHVCVGAVLAGAVACQSGELPDVDPPVEPTAPATGFLVAGPVVDLASSVPAAQLAFTHDANGYRGGYATHAVTVREGIIDVTPRHRDPVTQEQLVGGAIGLQTTAVLVGADNLDVSADVHVQAAPNVLRIDRGEVTEEVTNREDGVEQAWWFANKPVGGDLTVEVAVSGHQFVVANDSGLHFKSPRGLGVRYSHAIWRDANGTDYDISARFEDGRILITVPEAIVDASAYPAVLDPTITAELFTDSPAMGTTGANNRNQDITSNGSGYFAVWQDQRASRNDDIYGTRVGAAGAVVDASGIAINTAAGTQQNPTVAFVGTGYVVAWENVVAAGNSDIAAAFVSTAGAVTQLGTIAGTGANETLPAIAARGSQALLVWNDGANIRGAVFSGAAFGTAFNVAASANVEKDPAVSCNPAGDYLVAYAETVAAGNDDIRGILVTPAGAPGTAFTIDATAGVQATPAAEFNGTNHVIVWNTAANIAGARVSATGTLVDATPVLINTNAAAQQFPDIACNASNCVVAWQDARNAASVRDVYGALITNALAVTANDIAIATQTRAQLTPAVAAAGTAFFATWSDNRDLEYTYVRGGRIDGGGAVIDTDGIVLATSTSNFQAPAVAQASLTDVYFADSQSPDVNLVHVRFSGTGAQIDNPPKLVSGTSGAQLGPAAATVGSNSLVVWQDTRGADRDIYAARVSVTTGAPIDTAGIPVSTATADQAAPDIASAGSTALVVWQDRRNGVTTGFDIYAAVLDANGAVTVNNIAVCAGAGDQSAPKVAYDSVNGVYLVVFNEPAGVDIRGVRVSAAGAVLDANCGVAISSGAGSQFNADVAYGGGRFMVAWEDRRNDAARGDIYGARVNANNNVLTVEDANGVAIAQVSGSVQNQVTVAFGTSYAGSYLVAWSDQRNAVTNGSDIYGAQVGVTNGVASAAFAIAATTENETSAALEAGASSVKPFSIAYNKTNSALGSTRLQFRRITLGTAGGQYCTQNSQCETGFCSDGVCCDTACGTSNRSDCQACSVRLGGSVDGTCTVIAASNNYICRDLANRTDTPLCDVREYCNGVDAACPPDVGQRQGQACTSGAGVPGTCPANDVTGAPHVCQ